MATLYRTPNIKIDKHEWHAAVENRNSPRSRIYYRFRAPGGMWRPIGDWQGRKPKGLNEFFRKFRAHMSLALMQGP